MNLLQIIPLIIALQGPPDPGPLMEAAAKLATMDRATVEAIYSAQDAALASWSPIAYPGDLDNDGDVDTTDLLALLAEWSKPGDQPGWSYADIDGSGRVDVRDLLTLLGRWTDAHGWTILTPAPDTIITYVDPAGNDAANGLTPQAAVRTLAEGVRRLRPGSADWLLLKRGGEWTGNLGTWAKDGRSASERVVVAYYGQGARPKVNAGAQLLTGWNGLSHVAFVGLEIEGNGGDDLVDIRPGPGKVVEDVLWEDMDMHGGARAFLFDGTSGSSPTRIRGITIRRSHLHHNGADQDNKQAIYSWNARLLVDECVIDFNGVFADGSFHGHNHGVYMDGDSGGCGYTLTRLLVTRNGAQGFKMQPGGSDSHAIRDCLAALQPIHMGVGGRHSSQTEKGGLRIDIAGNVLVEATRNGWGIVLNNIESGVVSSNIVAHNLNPPGNAILAGDPMFSSDGVGVFCAIVGNVLHNWGSGIAVRPGGPYDIQIADNWSDQPTVGGTLAGVALDEQPAPPTYRNPDMTLTTWLAGRGLSLDQWMAQIRGGTRQTGWIGWQDAMAAFREAYSEASE
jgi:hypothetical protein